MKQKNTGGLDKSGGKMQEAAGGTRSAHQDLGEQTASIQTSSKASMGELFAANVGQITVWNRLQLLASGRSDRPGRGWRATVEGVPTHTPILRNKLER